MRLLRAELAKLRRPLTWGVMVAAAAFCVLLAAGGAHNATADVASLPRTLPTCAQLGVGAGPRCDDAMALWRDRFDHVRGEPARVAAQLSPLAAGAEAAGLIASLPGAVAMALLAGAHAGGEWSGRTMKNLLVQHGRRWQVLAAKLVSLWLTGIGLMAACWAALALAGPVIAASVHLPDPHLAAGQALAMAGPQVARASLVVATFATIGLLAALITRSAIGTTAATAVTVAAMLVMAGLPGLGRWAPATWVQGWMGFPAGQASISPLPGNFWSRFIPVSGSAPGHLPGLAGLTALMAAGLLVSWQVFRHADVSG